MGIELVVQVSPGSRVPLQASPESTLTQVLASVGSSGASSSMRYLQTTVPRSQWDAMTLADLGLQSGDRALLVLESSVPAGLDTEDQDVVMSSSDSTALQDALSRILKSNFDEDSQSCIMTLLKILDNVIQKPNNPKVRSIRLANPLVAEKVVARGGVDYLLACGFERQSMAPPLLAKSDQGEECLVLTEANESTAHLVKARRLLMQTAIEELNMKADELPKYKPPPAPAAPAPSQNASSFNPYQRHRHNTTGQPEHPGTYVSTTETKLRQLQSQHDRLEAKLQGDAVLDRELVALRPQQQSPIVSLNNPTASSTAAGPSDGALLAQRMQRLEQERKEREEGGFTTKAMRDLQKMKKTRVYSHAKLRIQFPDGTALEAKFLPKETVDTVKTVIDECFSDQVALQFDLYVAPPRRKLDVARTLQEEGLVPAAKCFVSWKGGSAPGANFLMEELFRSDAAAPAYPTAKPVVPEAKKKKSEDAQGAPPKKASREEELMRRMMGGASGGSSGSSNAKKPGADKPKWFKG